jgi:hypothetical protein
MSEGNQGSEPKRPGSSWHAWVSPQPAEEAPLASTEMGGPGVPLAVLPAIVARLERVERALDRLQRVESAIDRLLADIGGLESSAERSSATVIAQVDALRVGFAGPLGELGALLTTRLDGLGEVLTTGLDGLGEVLTTGLDGLGEVSTTRLDGLGEVLTTGLAGLGLDFAELMEALTESVDGIASAPAPLPPPPPPAPVVDLAPIEDLQRSVDALADEVRAAADAPPPAPAAPAPAAGPAAEDIARLLLAAEELASQVASVQDEVTQLKRRVGVRAKVPIVLDDAQMDDLANRVATHLERTFEITD